MSIKIIHTADNHIGISYNSLDNAKETLLQERLDSLKRIVDEGNRQECNFLVVAGDLFDKTTISVTNIKKVIEFLRMFKGEVLIIPGNHDYFEADPNSLWSKFKTNSSNYSNIIVLTNDIPYCTEAKDKKVNFYPAPCRSMHSSENAIGWIKQTPINKDEINIGIAHGNVETLGRDEKNNYFNMSIPELTSIDVDFWLLGHIHVTYPEQAVVTQNTKIFMSGTHMPDSWKSVGKGNAWVIEISDNKQVSATKFEPSWFEYVSFQSEINSLGDVNSLLSSINRLDKQKVALKLDINGRLNQEDKNTCNSQIKDAINDFLYTEVENNIERLIDQAMIDERFPDGSVPNLLLTELLNDGESMGVQKVFESLQKLQSK